MREVQIGTIVDYVELINELGDSAACFRGAKHPVEDMRPTVVRSWRRHQRIQEAQGGCSRLELWQYEARLVEAFQRRSLPFLEAMPDCHLNWLAVAQHYQLPTRLLDWSRNPLVALYFAATDRGWHETREDWADAYVFAWKVGDTLDLDDYVLPLDRVRAMQPTEKGLIIDIQARSNDGLNLFSPPLIASRFAAQEGLFSFAEAISDTSFCDAAEQAGLSLTRITVPGAARLGILKQLNRLGVETERLFRDLPGLCAHQRWVAEWLW